MKRMIYRATIWTMVCVCSLAGCGQMGGRAQEMQASDRAVSLDCVVIPDSGAAQGGTSISGNGTMLSGASIQGSGTAQSGASVSGSGTAQSGASVSGSGTVRSDMSVSDGGATSGGISTLNEADATYSWEEKMDAYQAALERLYTDEVFPDGLKYYKEWDNMFDKTNHCFAIYDIDFDGKDELILRYTDTIIAGMREIIYDYDNVSGEFRVEFFDFPELTFYDNGVVKANMSHSSAINGEFCPFAVYVYVEGADAYAETGGASAWDKNFYSGGDCDGNSFPEDIDINGDGIVYYVMGGKYRENTIVDLEEYNQWWDSIVKNAKEIDIPFQKFMEYVQKYSVCTSKSVWEVERFARKVKEQILHGDFQGLSKEIAYPITVNGITYQNEEDFVKAELAGKLNPEILAELEAESCEGMFANWQGIMLGNGCVWIGEDMASQELKVITLNGFLLTDAARQ